MTRSPAGFALAIALAIVIPFAAGPMWTELVTVVKLAPLSLEDKLEARDYWAAMELPVVRQIERTLADDVPIVLEPVGVHGWYVALAVQPRRVYYDRPEIVDGLRNRGETPARLVATGSQGPLLRWLIDRPAQTLPVDRYEDPAREPSPPVPDVP